MREEGGGRREEGGGRREEGAGRREEGAGRRGGGKLRLSFIIFNSFIFWVLASFTTIK